MRMARILSHKKYNFHNKDHGTFNASVKFMEQNKRHWIEIRETTGKVEMSMEGDKAYLNKQMTKIQSGMSVTSLEKLGFKLVSAPVLTVITETVENEIDVEPEIYSQDLDLSFTNEPELETENSE